MLCQFLLFDKGTQLYISQIFSEPFLGIHVHFLIVPTYAFFFFFLVFSSATPAAYGGSQTRSLIRAVATGLRQSHSNVGSEPSLQPTPWLKATPDP